MKKFFVGCNLKFEDELETELREVWPFLLDLDGRPHAQSLQIIEKYPGGILLEAPLHLGLQLNSFSRLANRVLLRLMEFKVRDFPKLHQKLLQLKKDPFLQGLQFQFKIAASQSRLNNEKRIQQVFEQIFGPENPSHKDTLYVRMFDDLCTISLDTTGEHLHFRSRKTELGKAPIRETIAAFCLRKMMDGFSRSHLQEISLIDPMMGTGTFLKEAHQLFRRSSRSDYAYLYWAQTPKLLKSESLAKNDLTDQALFGAYYGSDRDSGVVKIAREQLSNLIPLAHLKEQDLFKAPVMKNIRSWVISNPPYGERLQVDFTPSQLFQKIIESYNPEQIGLVLSENQFKELLRTYEQAQGTSKPAEERMHLKDNWSFNNGGLGVRFVLFSRFVEDFSSKSTSLDN